VSNLDRHTAWQQRLRRYERGNTTVAEFCHHEQVSVAAFYYWKRRLSELDESNASIPSFIPVNVTSSVGREIRIALPGGATVHLPADCSREILESCIVAAGRVMRDEESSC